MGVTQDFNYRRDNYKNKELSFLHMKHLQIMIYVSTTYDQHIPNHKDGSQVHSEEITKKWT